MQSVQTFSNTRDIKQETPHNCIVLIITPGHVGEDARTTGRKDERMAEREEDRTTAATLMTLQRN